MFFSSYFCAGQETEKPDINTLIELVRSWYSSVVLDLSDCLINFMYSCSFAVFVIWRCKLPNTQAFLPFLM